MIIRCERCGESVQVAGVGRTPRFCSTRCRVAAHRANRMPAEMTDRDQWVRADGKRPIRTNGRAASSTDRTTWTSYRAVKTSAKGDGMGIMLGSGLGCYDLDHMTDNEARRFIVGIPERVVYIERSMSGDGVHVFIEAPEGVGTRCRNVERYTAARFIRTTGRTFA